MFDHVWAVYVEMTMGEEKQVGKLFTGEKTFIGVWCGMIMCV